MNSTCDPLPAQARRAEADDAVFERAYVEGLLRDRESLWHALFAQSRDGVVVLDEAGKVYETNQRFADLLGYTMDELYQLHVWDWAHGLSPEDTCDRVEAFFDAVPGRLNELWLHRAGDAGFTRHLTGPDQPDFAAFCPAPGHNFGFNEQKVIEARDLLSAIAGGPAAGPNFAAGLAIERIIHAMAASGGRPVRL